MIVSFSVVSLIAIVPDNECRTPILIVSWASAAPGTARTAARGQRVRNLCVRFMIDLLDGSHLHLKPDADLLVVALHGGEVLLQVEEHHARVEIPDHVVEIHLGGFLVVVAVDRGEAVSKARLRELAEELHPAGHPGCRWKQITGENIAALIGAVSRAVTAQPVVLRQFRFDRKRAAAAKLLLEQEVAVVRLVAILHLAGGGEGEDVLLAVERAVQVIARLRIPEIDLDAAGADQLALAGRRRAVVCARLQLHLPELAPVERAVVAPRGDERVAVL